MRSGSPRSEHLYYPAHHCGHPGRDEKLPKDSEQVKDNHSTQELQRTAFLQESLLPGKDLDLEFLCNKR